MIQQVKLCPIAKTPCYGELCLYWKEYHNKWQMDHCGERGDCLFSLVIESIIKQYSPEFLSRFEENASPEDNDVIVPFDNIESSKD